GESQGDRESSQGQPVRDLAAAGVEDTCHEREDEGEEGEHVTRLFVLVPADQQHVFLGRAELTLEMLANLVPNANSADDDDGHEDDVFDRRETPFVAEEVSGGLRVLRDECHIVSSFLFRGAHCARLVRCDARAPGWTAVFGGRAKELSCWGVCRTDAGAVAEKVRGGVV